MQLLKQSTLIALALVAIAAAPQAIAAKVVCEFNKTTGKLEPTLAWKNTLGSEADDACALAMQAPKNNQILSTPAMPGQASAVLLAGSAPVPPNKIIPLLLPTPATAQAQLIYSARPVVLPPPIALSLIQAATHQKTNTITEATWKVELKDITLSTTFARWADAAGWKLRWDADKNILIDAPDSFTGVFEDAVASVLSSDGIQRGAYPLEVCFYTNTPPLARITRKGEQKDCK